MVQQIVSNESANITVGSAVKNQQDEIQDFLSNSSTEISCST